MNINRNNSYFNFLRLLLQVTKESNSNPEMLYYLLQNNIDKLDEKFAEVLYQFSITTLSTLQSEEVYEVVRCISNLSVFIQNFPTSNRRDCQEIAIKGYQAVISFLTFETFPVMWANIQNNLGIVYYDRIKGRKKDNVEYAIFCLQESLKVFIPKDYPYEWARTQSNLGNAYWNRIKGERADNIELAIVYYQESLKVNTFERYPYEWANIQNSLGNVYWNRIKGDKRKNIEQAINYCRESLKVYTSEAFPYECARSKINLGNAYWNRIKGDKTDNIELALACFQESLKVYTSETFPYEWANIQNNLGNAYWRRVKGDKTDNIEMAIACFQESLKVFTLEAFPCEWANIQNNLGNAYNDRIKGKKEHNVESAIFCLRESLKVYTQEAFPYEWARTQNNLGGSYNNRLNGEYSENVEQAIAFYQSSLKVYTQEAFPYEWERTQNNLENAYKNRIKENKADNIEKLIADHKESLNRYTEEVFPDEWANIQYKLGFAYWKRIKGRKVENIEEAIIYFNNSLRIYTKETYSDEWARSQNGLGGAYISRIKGEKADNLEKGISYLQVSLEIYTLEAFPYEWAMSNNNLGIAYNDRIKGEKANNLEQAIAYYQNSLKVYKKETLPSEWANIQNNLGNTYWARIRGKKEDNLEESINYSKLSLEVYTPEVFPEKWASTHNNLGLIYSDRIKGNKEDNLEEAISYLQKSLKVYTLEAFPFEWARSQNNLGLNYNNRIKGKKEDNLEEAISYFQKSLKVHTFEDFPYEWAMSQNNLGLTFRDRIKEQKVENIEKAIFHFRESLKVCTPQSFPIDCMRYARNLGNLAFKRKNWEIAIKAYNRAIEALEISRSWAKTFQTKQETIEPVIDIYYNIVQALLNTDQFSLALEYVERSKTRNLVELVDTRNIQPKGKFPPAVLSKLSLLRNKINTEQIYLANEERRYDSLLKASQSTQSSSPDRTQLQKLQQELDELIQYDISPIDSTFSLTQKVEIITFDEIKTITDERTAIIEWYITGDKVLVFIVTHQNRYPQMWQSSTEDRKNLESWASEYIKAYYLKPQQWKTNLEASLAKLAEILHLEEILSFVPEECDNLILIPHRFLHFVPLNALPVSERRNSRKKSKSLLDLFPQGIKYAPSCQLFKVAKSQQQQSIKSLFAIQNPTNDLIYTDLEVETISSFFLNTEVLAKQTANKASLKLNQNLNSANCVHFSCHGKFNFELPLESALILSKTETSTINRDLTLAEIFELSLQECRIVILSACETGLTEFNSLSDEYIGLPSGFLFAGSPSIVSSLWTVSDLSTAFLMIKFYEHLFQLPQSVEVAMSLQKAQQWLRNLTCREFEQELVKPQYQKALAQLKQKFSSAEFFELEDAIEVEREKLKKFHPDDKPFSNPFYWAAFIATGV